MAATSASRPSGPREGKPCFLILEDHALVREGVAERLRRSFPGSGTCYSGASLKEATKALRARRSDAAATACDCAIVDLDLGDGTSVAEVVSTIANFSVPVVVMSAMAQAEVLQAALTAGAVAFVTKRSSMDNLEHAVRTAMSGGTWISPDLAGVLVKAEQSIGLTEREQRALVLYASGMTLDMVANRMGVTTNTVKYYLDRVRKKYLEAGISARTKVELNAAARSQGLIP